MVDSYKNFGCFFKDPQTHELMHHVEKPDVFNVNDYLINCGIYFF